MITRLLCGIRNLFQNHKMKAAGLITSAVVLSTGLAGCNFSLINTPANTVVVGGKNFTEQDIMANMLTLLIEHDTKLHVQQHTWLDSNVAWKAMDHGAIDLYVEYTGTGLVNILNDKPMSDPNKVYNTVQSQFQKQYNVTWLKPIGFNNTYAMVMKASEAKKLHISTISDLAKQSSHLVFGTEQDFITRHDGLPALKATYGVNFKSVKSMDLGLKYRALNDQQVDVIDAFSTDGEIPANNLVVLKDDKHLFPPYYAAPIIRNSVLKKHPELAAVVNKLAGQINDQEMQQLNEKVDIDHESAEYVAKQWLTAHHLI